MKIHELKIKGFRNLRNFEITFTEDITMLLGKNGSAKSNLIEAIALIFSKIELGEPAPFAYFLRYECNSRTVEIDAGYGQTTSFRVKAGAEEIDYDSFVNEKAPAQFAEAETEETAEPADEESRPQHRKYAPFFPSNVFIYYSGQSDRLANACAPVKEKYESELREGNDPRLRRVFLTDGSHSSLILFTFFAEASQWAKDFLLERLGITDLLSVRLSLSRPQYLDTTERGYPSLRPEVESKYWYASGRVLKTLKVLQQGSIPLRDFRKVSEKELLESYREGTPLSLEPVDSQYIQSSAPQRLHRLHFYFGSSGQPDALCGKLLLENGFPLLLESGGSLLLNSALRPKDLFQRLDDLRLDGYGLELHFRLKLERASESVSLTHLSEGEQQLLTVIGLLRFTKDNDTLFLLDEPDTHLNPQWSYEYKKMLEEAMEGASGSQIIMATHDPVLIAGLTKENVRLMERKGVAEAPDEAEWIIEARPPDEDPQGKGVARILEGELFGLPSILDQDSLNKLEEKRRLAFKEEKLTEEEEARLNQLARETQDIDLTTHIEDPLYTHFVNAIVNHEDYLLLKRHYSTDSRFAALKRISEKVREELLRKAQTAEAYEEEVE
ncbi:MAG: DNA replication and repair protein RecF [Gammaproteobacteria bacterium]|nr:DNA replication and repair protein RecF [Gammaproteobacteria bacterium]